MLDTGTDAPAFELPNQDGETVALSDFDGEYVVVYFYPRADTPGCTTEACGFRDAIEEFREKGTNVVGISDDPVEDLKAFAEKYDLPFDLLSDEDGAVAGAYDSYGEKTIGGEDVTGTFRNTYVVGPNGEIVAAHEGVSPDGHADELLRDLDELGV